MISANRVLSQEVIQGPSWYKNRTLVTFSVISATKTTATTLAAISPQEYLSLAQNLVNNGRAEKKIGQVIAFELTELAALTQQDSGAAETEQGMIDPRKTIVFDPTYFSVDQARYTEEKIFQLYGQAMTKSEICDALSSGQLVKCVVSSIGIWTLETNRFYAEQLRGRGFKGDYIRTDMPSVYKTREGTGRIVTGHLGGDTKTICRWTGGFELRKGAGVATLFTEMPQIIEALKQIAAEGNTDEAIIKHLMTKDLQTGELIAKFDIYGMFPAFRENNYRSITAADPLTDEGKAAVAALANAGNTTALAPAPKKRGALMRLMGG